MKILSSFKDYYDFEVQKYGLDEKIVFERISKEVKDYNTKNEITTKVPFTYDIHQKDKGLLQFHICGLTYDVLQIDGLFYMGEDLKAFDYYKEVNKKKYFYKGSKYGIDYIKIDIGFKRTQEQDFKLTPVKSMVNDILNEPIIFQKTKFNFIINPKLEFFKFGSLFPSEDMWQMLVNWFSQEKTIVDNRDNTAKILSNGFDLKESFRNNIKQ